MAQAPLDRSLARPTDAPPLAHEPADDAVAPAEAAPAEAPLLAPEDLPRHVAIIMDGNRRWARARGLPDFDGHAAGVEAIRGLLQHAVRRGVPMLTLYAFSRENWARSDDEVAGPVLRCSARPSTTRRTSCARRASRCACSVASRSSPTRRARSISQALDQTAEGTRLVLNIAWNYAGRTELVDAFRRIAASGIPSDQVDERTISEALYTAGLPDPDLVIRTGGEQRISNFLIWQSAYAELVFSDSLWPDFGPDAFDEALLEFARRTRRFGR